MGLMRPGTKVRYWTPGYKNRPSVEPPALLRLVSALSICSVVGALIYSVLSVLHFGGLNLPATTAAYVALLHFLLPLGIAYSVATNSPLSRPAILIYTLLLCGATAIGVGYLGSLEIDSSIRIAASVILLVTVALWLYRSPRMRVFYAAIAGKPIPDGLAEESDELLASNRIDPRTRAVIDWVSDHLETVVLVGFIVVVIYAFSTTH